MPDAPLLTEEECNVDVCVLGTGLTESLAAAALARHGKTVLHLDRRSAYGGDWRALNLADFESWASGTDDAPFDVAPASQDLSDFTVVQLAADPPASCFTCRHLVWDPYQAKSEEDLEALRSELKKRANAFSIDLVPRLLFGRSEFVDVLVESGVARYLEFQGLKSARVLTQQGLASVPLTKSDIFQDPVLSLGEKRMLMRFITSMSPFVGSLAFESPATLGVDQARKVPAPKEEAAASLDGVDLDQPWPSFLAEQKLSPRLQEFLTYAICLWDWALPSPSQEEPQRGSVGLTAREGLRLLGRFVSSLGVHGRGTSMPLLYPMYGIAEVAQGFTRMCALHHGTYALRTCAVQLLAKQDSSEADEQESWRVAGIVTQRGEVIRASSVVTSCEHIWQGGAEAPPPQTNAWTSAAVGAEGGVVVACKRMTVLLDCPLLGEEGLGFCVVPPGVTDPRLSNVVQVLQLDWTTGTCPRDHFIVHLSQAVRWADVEENQATGDAQFRDLEAVLQALLSHAEGKAHCLFRCSYLHRERRLQRWDETSRDGKVLQSCADSHSLVVCADPAAVPQLLAGAEVDEARSAFLRAPLSAPEGQPTTKDDFLRKPEHVAQEEQGSAMEELEQFNEDMLSAERAAGA